MDTLAASDLLLFVNAAITSTGQREFRGDAGQQRLSLDFLHSYMLGNYRDLYTSALALDINDHNAALIVRRLLGSPGEASLDERRLEGRLIAARLALLPPQRVYDLFGALRKSRVNNRMTRAIIRDWLAARPDPAFDAVKYRNAVKEAVRHAHLAPPNELGRFLFAPRGQKRYTTAILDSWRRAHYEQAAVYELPFTVAEGFAARHKIDRAVFLERARPTMTRLERLRLHGAADRAGVDVAVDLAAMPLTRLASYVLSLSLDDRAARRAELTGALRAAARRAAGRHAGRWGRVVGVLDDSFSSIGSVQKRRRPLAVALAAHFPLAALADTYVPLWTSGRTDALLLYPFGATPLGERVLDGLEHTPERLLIVSDGWDNAPPGLAAEVLRVWRARLDPLRRTAVVHLNPVYDADDFDVRRRSADVPTVGVRDAEDIPALVEFAQLAARGGELDVLRSHLAQRTAQFLGETS
jgi:hypothetical protein